MNSYWKLSRQLIYFRRIPSHVVAATAVASLLLSVGIYYQGLPLYLVVLYALMPWLPILFFEGLWKVKHYHWFAIFAVFTVLQLGHVMEHVVQAGALVMTDATLACPPPVDNLTNAQMAIEAGLRDVTNLPTGMSARIIVQPDAVGQVTYTDAGSWVTGPPACGIFGQLDLEIVHLVWELIGWGLSLVLLLCFPHSKWLWVSIAWASIHTVEHLFISYTFFLDPAYVYEGTRQIWATVADGNIVTAYPVGREAAMLNFYDVAGKFGIAAKNGLIGTFFPALNPYLPERAYLHLYYNLLVTIPGTLAFLTEIRGTYDRYLKRVLPQLDTQEMVNLTRHLAYRRYQTGETIINGNDVADAFYIIASGRVEVLDDRNRSLDSLDTGDSFGGGKRSASVRTLTDVELLRIERATFDELVSQGRFEISY